MIFFPYWFILTLGSIILFNISIFVSSFDHDPIRNEKHILHSKRLFGRKLGNVKRRIFGGHVATDIRSYPYMAYILRVIRKRNSSIILRNVESCGSTLLSPTHALSAAHCFRSCPCKHIADDNDCQKCFFWNVKNYILHAGSTVANNSLMRSNLKNIYIHPEHKFKDKTHKCIHRYDIAVVKLATPLKFSNKIAAIKLPRPVTIGSDNLDSTFTTKLFNSNKKCLIVGWGLVSLHDNTNFLKEKLMVAQVPLIGLDNCEIDFHYRKGKIKKGIKTVVCRDTDICSKSLNFKTGVCQGDSGGPIICDGVQVGVSSWSNSWCVGPHTPSMYTRVEICVKWIRDIMSGKNIEGLYMK